LFRNQNACDFRASRYNNSDHLSTVLCAEDKTGHGVIMNSSFSITDLMYPPKLAMNNMHEFNIIEEGRTGLAIIGRTELVDISELGIYEEVGWVANVGFREFDVATGQTKFEWWALDHVPLSASSEKIGKIKGPHPSGWNYLYALPKHVLEVCKLIG
jgi:hypothetical protein